MIINADSKLAKIRLYPLNGLTAGERRVNYCVLTKMKEHGNERTCNKTQSISKEN